MNIWTSGGRLATDVSAQLIRLLFFQGQVRRGNSLYLLRKLHDVCIGTYKFCSYDGMVCKGVESLRAATCPDKFFVGKEYFAKFTEGSEGNRLIMGRTQQLELRYDRIQSADSYRTPGNETHVIFTGNSLSARLTFHVIIVGL